LKLDFPFSAVVGQDDLKLALLLVAVDPSIGGVLISGERGTAKSTAARGVAALLPKRPDGRAAPFVELPLGATEDRVVGALDISKVLKDGNMELRSGLLARADGGVLYVDEVNLLADHIVDLLLDAAASGWVSVERDGISAGEAARFVLIGTMNPEEGELRPQFVDRFGLCVQVRGLGAHDLRIAAIRQRLAFDDSPEKVVEAAHAEEQALREAILDSRERLGRLSVTDAHLALAAALSVEHHLDGIRGDLAIIKAARALAAWQGVPEILEAHIRRAAEFALPHRMRPRTAKGQSPAAARPTLSDQERRPPGTDAAGSAPQPAENSPRQLAAPAAERGPLHMLTDLIDRDRPGRRGTESLAAQRVTRVVPYELTGGLAIHETLVAAAKRGARVMEQGVPLAAADLMQHECRGTGRSHVLFLVDASGSMATQRRLELAKGAALGLLTSSYQRRDEVALMAFRASGTDLVLPFTRHVASIEGALRELPTGGRTPLARALLDATLLLQSREPALLVLMTDGRANVSANGGDPWEEALAACASLQMACAGALVIDCEPGPIILGRPRILARTLGAQCVALESLDAPALTLRIHQHLEKL
jgi:magnesium chelatase subunit D